MKCSYYKPNLLISDILNWQQSPKTPPYNMADLLYRRLRKITDWSLLIGFIDRFFGSERAASGAGWSFLCVIGLSQPETGRLSLPAAHHIWSFIRQNGRNIDMHRINTFGRLQTGISHIKLPCWHNFLPPLSLCLSVSVGGSKFTAVLLHNSAD